MKRTFYGIVTLVFFAVGGFSAATTSAASLGLVGEPFRMIDLDKDKKLLEREFIGRKSGENKERARRKFRMLDSDQDNSLRSSEYKREGLWDRPRTKEMEFRPRGAWRMGN